MKTLRSSLSWLSVVLFLWSDGRVIAASASDLEFFEKRIRPIFSQHCYACHSEAEGKVKGGLQLDWKGGWEKGGTSGPAVVPGNPESSLLIKAVRYVGETWLRPSHRNNVAAAIVANVNENAL